VEGDIWFAAKQLMRQGGAALEREYELNEELAAEDGLVCGGTMYFLIDPAYSPDDYRMYATEIRDAYEGNGAVALASIVKSPNGANRTTGEKLFVRENGSTNGTLGSDSIDEEATNKALELMAHGNSEYVRAKDGTEYFVEAYTTPPQMILCGGGHVSKAIAPLAKSLGFRIFITDDREEFADAVRFPEADMIVAKTPENALSQLPINANSFIIIATRGHRYDNVALEAAAMTSARYVGLLGSKRKTILIYEDLVSNGIPIPRVREIRSPIGLDINARTPAEIAISIMAEILMFRLGGTGAPMKLEDWRLTRIIEKVQGQKTAAVR
jgi:xanthine dehydrogenase accessory factor